MTESRAEQDLLEITGPRDGVQPQSPGDIRLRRMRHPWRVTGFVLITTLLLCAAFIAGAFVRSPEDGALQAAQEQIAVTAVVEERVVSDSFALPATVVAGNAADIVITEPSIQASATAPTAEQNNGAASGTDETSPTVGESGRVVVTATGISAGETVVAGRLLAEVSGRPLFALPADIPLYRDVAPGDSGNDVAALKRLLLDLGYGGGRTAATLDGGTIDALERMYDDAGYALPYVADGVQGIAWREFVALPAGSGRVISAAPVGTVLGPEVALARVETSAATLQARVTVLQRDRISEGTSIGVSVGGAAPTASTVISLGAFSTDATTGVSGHPIVVALPDGVPADGSSPVQLVSLDTPAASLAVPAIALLQEGNRAFVTLAPPAQENAETETPSPQERVEVKVLAQADGWVAIEANERLPKGTRVLIE